MAIRNTTNRVDTEVFLSVAMAGGSAVGVIEAQEVQGQRELVASTQLPVKINSGERKTLEKAGVVFGPPTPGDPIFCDCTLPKDWMLQATSHPMWTNLVDETGKVRATIFYKAAFYDRDAFINIENV